MRLAPVVLYFFPDDEAIENRAPDSSRTTHGAPEAVAACRMLAGYLTAALRGESKADLIRSVAPQDWMSDSLRGIAAGEYGRKTRAEIKGTGYVVPSLEAALWCFATTDMFKEAIPHGREPGR